MRDNLVPAAVGFVTFALFVGYLALRLGEPALSLIIGGVLVLCLFDFVTNLREG